MAVVRHMHCIASSMDDPDCTPYLSTEYSRTSNPSSRQVLHKYQAGNLSDDGLILHAIILTPRIFVVLFSPKTSLLYICMSFATSFTIIIRMGLGTI